MATTLDRQVIQDNKKYASAYTSSGLDVHPAKKLVVVTCMDCRLNPQEALGWELGDVTIVRNAGASAVEGARSILATTHMLGARDVYVIKHTRCGLLGATTEMVHSVMKRNLGLAESKEVDAFEVLPIANLGDSLRDDVDFLRSHPLSMVDVRVTGWIFDTDTGLIRQVIE